MVHVTLLYFDDCPNWRTARDHLHTAIQRLGAEHFDVELRLIVSLEQALAHDFHGSPTILLDGRDPFADPDAAVGLACRVYQTPDGLSGAPTVAQLLHALDRALAGPAEPRP